MSTRPGWPSIGFLAVCLTYLLVAGFFLWGFSTPNLDRVWTFHHGLRTGEMKRLRPGERKLLQGALERHSALASSLLDGRSIGLISAHGDGWIATPTATALRTPESAGVAHVHLDAQTPRDLLPYLVEIRGNGWKKTVEVAEQGALDVPVPDPPALPEILEIRMRGQDFKADPSMLGLRVTFPEPP